MRAPATLVLLGCVASICREFKAHLLVPPPASPSPPLWRTRPTPPSSCEDFPWKPLAYPPASLSLAHPLAPLPPFPSRNRLLVPPPSRSRAHLLVPPPVSPSPPLLRTRSTPPQ